MGGMLVDGMVRQFEGGVVTVMVVVVAVVVNYSTARASVQAESKCAPNGEPNVLCSWQGRQ